MKKSNLLLILLGVAVIITGYTLTIVTHPLIGLALIGIYLLFSTIKLIIEHKDKEETDLKQENILTKVDKISEDFTTILTIIPSDISKNNIKLANEDRIRILEASKHIQDLSLYSPLAQVETYYRLGNFFFIERDFDKAIECYDKVIHINPNYINAYYNKSRALSEINRSEEAIKTMSIAMELSPPSNAIASSLVNLACALTALGRYSEALEKYDQALEKKPNEPWWYYSAAEVSEKVGDYRKTLEYLKKFLILAETQDKCVQKIPEVMQKIESLKKFSNKMPNHEHQL